MEINADMTGKTLCLLNANPIFFNLYRKFCDNRTSSSNYVFCSYLQTHLNKFAAVISK